MCLPPGLGALKLHRARLLASSGISLYFYMISLHCFSNMEPSGRPNFLLVDSGLLKCIWQRGSQADAILPFIT